VLWVERANLLSVNPATVSGDSQLQICTAVVSLSDGGVAVMIWMKQEIFTALGRTWTQTIHRSSGTKFTKQTIGCSPGTIIYFHT
jgi:hypothetical protein